MTNGLLIQYMGKYLRLSSYIRKPFLIYDFATVPNFLIYEENLIFFFIRVFLPFHIPLPSRKAGPSPVCKVPPVHHLLPLSLPCLQYWWIDNGSRKSLPPSPSPPLPSPPLHSILPDIGDNENHPLAS